MDLTETDVANLADNSHRLKLLAQELRYRLLDNALLQPMGLTTYDEEGAKTIYISDEYGDTTINLTKKLGAVVRPPKQMVYHTPPDYIYRMNDVTVAPRQILIKEGRLLPDTFRRFNGRHNFLEKVETDMFRPKFPVEPLARVSEPCFYFDGEIVDHYGHFITEILSRLWCFKDIDLKNFRFITSLNNLEWSFFLRPFNVKATAILRITHPVQVDDLFIANQGIVLGRWMSPKTFSVYNHIAKYYINDTNKTGPSRIYVSRTKLKGLRNLVNELEIEDLFKRKGFQIIYPETMSFYEQINVFSEASIVAGCFCFGHV